MAGFRRFQQTSCITHQVCIAVEVSIHLPCLSTRLAGDDLHDLGFPKRSATIFNGFFNF